MGRLLVNYLGPEKTFPHVSVTDILGGRYEKGAFKDRIVLVGATAIGAHDLRSTPFSPVYPGVEVHATVIDNVVTGRFLAKPDWSTAYDLLAIIGLGAAIGIALPRMRALTGFLFSAGLFALYILIARWLFVRAGVWLDIVYPLLALAITYVALTVYYYVGEERQRKQIKETFRQYVPPLVVEALLKQPGRLKLGGEEKVLTVLFSDLEGFTSYSERYPPSDMIDMLSTYFGKMSEQVFANWGTLKEYVGDELMAIFGAPLEQADHAARACRTALAMRDARHALGAEWAKTGRPRLRARTGINSGLMLVGNLGSRYRFAYGVLGDQVNLASRLEGLNRTYGTEILIGGEHRPAGRGRVPPARGRHGPREGPQAGRARVRAPGSVRHGAPAGKGEGAERLRGRARGLPPAVLGRGAESLPAGAPPVAGGRPLSHDGGPNPDAPDIAPAR